MCYRRPRVYVSSSWEDKEVAHSIAILFMRMGYDITCEWWNHSGKNRLMYGIEDKIGVEDCDLFIFYNGEHKTTSKFVELGIAIGLGKPVRIYGNPISGVFGSNIMYCGKLPDDIVNNIEKYKRYNEIFYG